ncbi:MAG TPA: exopolysaccharide biosynthesis polyprenyl glycosylphosphotransferase [Candidatus Eisenbacteria bacterium]|nr:exopolysaccharide biosynthesis polyprenyl glycosylphosphotransferase [Candidatus Eisenbacteria bacterium]
MARQTAGTEVAGAATTADSGRVARTPAAGHGPLTRRLVFLPPDWLPRVLLAGDALIAGTSVLAAYAYRVRLDFINPEARDLLLGPYLLALPVAIAIYLFALFVNGQYRSWRGRMLVDQLLSLYTGLGLAAILVLATISLTRTGPLYSRLTITYSVIICAAAMTLERFVLREYETRLRRRGVGTERVLMVGTGTTSELLIRRMNMFPQYGYLCCGVADDQLEIGSRFAGVDVVGRLADLPRLAGELQVSKCFLAVPSARREQLVGLMKLCEDLHIEFRLVPDLLELMSTRADAESIDGLPLIGVRRRRVGVVSRTGKRLVDVVVSALGLAIAGLPMLVIAAAIKVTSPGGPVLFHQERIGRFRQPFLVHKFRTMIPDAEARTGPVVAVPGDPRVTPLGRFLRRTSLDELPQLINVLRGDMSLVGPRPQPTFFDERYSTEVPRYLERQQVRPGLTGWAEVNDLRGAVPIVDRTLYDVYYVENWSLLMDLKIILLTAVRLVTHRHAY